MVVRGLLVYRFTKFERNMRGRDFDLETLLDLWRSNGMMPGEILLHEMFWDHMLLLCWRVALSNGFEFCTASAHRVPCYLNINLTSGGQTV